MQVAIIPESPPLKKGFAVDQAEEIGFVSLIMPYFWEQCPKAVRRVWHKARPASEGADRLYLQHSLLRYHCTHHTFSRCHGECSAAASGRHSGSQLIAHSWTYCGRALRPATPQNRAIYHSMPFLPSPANSYSILDSSSHIAKLELHSMLQRAATRQWQLCANCFFLAMRAPYALEKGQLSGDLCIMDWDRCFGCGFSEVLWHDVYISMRSPLYTGRWQHVTSRKAQAFHSGA
jgi:hypothetical protein